VFDLHSAARKAGALILVLVTITPAFGVPPPSVNSTVDPTTALQQRLEYLEAEVQALRGGLAPSAYQSNGTTGTAPQHSSTADYVPPIADAPQPTVTPPTQWFTPAPEKPNYPTVKVTGFFHLDSAWFDQDANNIATLGDIQDGTGFRRARLAATGNVTEDVSYMFELDFAQAQALFVDVWMEFSDVSVLGNVRIGRFRQPFGMSELTGVRNLAFLERSTAFAFAPFRQTGIMANNTALDEHVTWAASVYRHLSDNYGNVYGDDGGWGLASRITLLPIYVDEGEYLLHLGADYSFNDPGRDEAQFASQDEVFVGQNPNLGPNGLDFLPLVGVPPFVNTGVIPTDDIHLFNLEAAAALGRLYLQSEARWAVVDRQNGLGTATFPALYAQARYVLTGEKLPYSKQSATFGRIVPDDPVHFGGCGGWGAWELAGRWSYIDLNAANLAGPGRRLNDLTLGVNWYLNGFTKFQFNYIHAFLDDPTLGDSDADTFALRAQVDF